MPKRKSALAKKREKKRNIFIGLFIFLFIALIVGIGFLVRLPEVTITEVRVDGAERIDAHAVERFVHEELSGSYVWLIPHKHTLLYPERSIEHSLEQNFFPIRLVDVSRDGFTKLVVAIEERQSVATWCSGLGTTSNCFRMDETGFLFEAGNSGSTLITYYGGIANEQPLGDHFIDGEFPVLQIFLKDLEHATNRSVGSVTIDEYDDVYVRFKEGGEIRFVRTYQPTVLLDSVASVFSSKRFETEEVFEYADFRFGNKIYVKFSEE